MPTIKTTFADVLRMLPDASDRAGLEMVAEGSGVPFHTLLKIANGETTDPRVSTFERLARYYRRKKAA